MPLAATLLALLLAEAAVDTSSPATCGERPSNPTELRDYYRCLRANPADTDGHQEGGDATSDAASGPSRAHGDTVASQTRAAGPAGVPSYVVVTKKDGSVVVGSVARELETGLLFRTADGSTDLIPYGSIEAIQETQPATSEPQNREASPSQRTPPQRVDGASGRDPRHQELLTRIEDLKVQRDVNVAGSVGVSLMGAGLSVFLFVSWPIGLVSMTVGAILGVVELSYDAEYTRQIERLQGQVGRLAAAGSSRSAARLLEAGGQVSAGG